MLFCRLLIFFKINLLKKKLQEYHQNVKQFGPRSGPTITEITVKFLVGPDLGPNCLPGLSADNTGIQRV